MLQFCDDLTPRDGDDWPWLRASDVLFAAQLDLGGPRCVGCFVEPATTVLGLRAWDDAREGATPMPWALFEVEKFVRMALRQSGVAFEALVAPAVWSRNFDGRAVAAAAVTRGILTYYDDVSRGLEHDFEPWRWRSLLTGALLATKGRVSLDDATLQRELGASEHPDADEVDAFRAMLRNRDALPERPQRFDWLDHLVVSLRCDGQLVPVKPSG